MNGSLNLSVLDGWWPEGCEHGVTGWAIGDGTEPLDADDARLHQDGGRALLLRPDGARVLRAALRLAAAATSPWRSRRPAPGRACGPGA
jgi:glucan phosphorylase